jgi:lipoprotein signal peptidase
MNAILLILAAVCNTLPRIVDIGTLTIMNGSKYSEMGRTCYYSGQALSYVLILLAMLFNRNKYAYELVLLLALSNLIDELFFDPTILGVNEILFAIILLIWTVYRLIKCSKN